MPALALLEVMKPHYEKTNMCTS